MLMKRSCARLDLGPPAEKCRRKKSRCSSPSVRKRVNSGTSNVRMKSARDSQNVVFFSKIPATARCAGKENESAVSKSRLLELFAFTSAPQPVRRRLTSLPPLQHGPALRSQRKKSILGGR